MLSRAIANGVVTAADVCVAEPVQARREHLTSTYGVTATAENAGAASSADIVVLAVKPQHLAHAMSDLAGKLATGQTALSIVAGVPVDTLVIGLKHERVVRVMPNTPAQIGEGMSVWTATPSVSEEARKWAAALLGALGREWYVADESYLDMATALSGSGPAYVFTFIEALVEAGVYMGMPRDMATALAVQTVAGSGALARETGQNPALLREMVTSPGGTTAEALRELERGGFRATLLEAVAAAHRKAKELGGKA